jgi:hypothetical protein
MRAVRIQAGQDLDPAFAAPSGLDLALGHPVLGLDLEHKAGAIPQDHGGLGQGQGLARPHLDLALGEHTGARRAADRQVHVNQTIAGDGVQGGGRHPDLAGHRLPTR